MPLVETGSATLFYQVDGPATAPVVVFSNSLGTTLSMWDEVVPALSDRFRCLRYDTRGHGRSPAIPGGLSVDDLADDLAGLLDALGIARASVVGLSLGGMTGQALAVRRPDLVERLAILASASFLPPADLWHDRAAMVRERGLGAVVANVIGRWFTPAGQTGAGAERIRRELVDQVSPEGYALCCEAIAAMDLRESIGRIRAPTLVVAGAADPATPPAMGAETASLIGGAAFATLPDAAHLLAVEKPDALLAVLRPFLESRGEDGGDRRPVPVPARSGDAFEAGLANRRQVLGEAHVARSLAAAGEFGTPWQDFITRYAWGEIWGDDTLPWKTRSAVTLSIMAALGREEEFKLHIRPALGNGFTTAELRALLKQVAVYAGVPAANAAFRWTRDVLGDDLA